MNTSGTYVVYSDTSRDTLLTGLTTASNWNGLANGVTGATVTGTPTAKLLMNSYNTKNGTSLVYTDVPTLDSSTEDYDLYVPHTSAYESCNGYWLASPYAGSTSGVWRVHCDGDVNGNGFHYAYSTFYGVRPVISLPSSIECSYADGVWTVE